MPKKSLTTMNNFVLWELFKTGTEEVEFLWFLWAFRE